MAVSATLGSDSLGLTTFAFVAQWIERPPSKRMVAGSSPAEGASTPRVHALGKTVSRIGRVTASPSNPSFQKTIAITGATGLIGAALGNYLRKGGHTVMRVVRRNPTGNDILWDPAAGSIEAEKLEGIDAVVHLAGHGIGDGKWTEEHKRKVMDSRVQGTTLLSKTLAGLGRKPYVLVSGSAVGFYGDRGSEVLTEASAAGTGFLADVVKQWEACTTAAEDAGIRVVHMRTGIVMSTNGGALKQQLLPFKLGLGGRLGKGTQYLPWVSITDELRAIEHIINTPTLTGPVNVCAPHPVANLEFTKALGKALKRPTLIPIPLAPLKVRYGPEMVKEMLLGGDNVLPAKLTESGFTFTHQTLEVALNAVLSEHI